MGKAVASLLAKRGANVIIVARNVSVLKEAIHEISVIPPQSSPSLSQFLEQERTSVTDPHDPKTFATYPTTQRFHHISADMTSASACADMLSAATAWNDHAPPDIIFACAGAAYPQLFAETSPDLLKEQMETNYLSAAYTAHAAIRAWLAHSHERRKHTDPSSSPAPQRQDPYHLILTSSLINFVPLVGYLPYTAGKRALGALTDTLSQEVQLYEHHTPIVPHTVFPGTIYTTAWDRENESKPAVTKMLEEGESDGQTPMQVAEAVLAGLDRGDEQIVTGGFQANLLRASMLGWNRRNGWGVLDTLLAWLVSIVFVVVRRDMDGKVRKWGREKGM